LTRDKATAAIGKLTLHVHLEGVPVTDRERLLAGITAQGASPGDIVVSLEDFFTGNDDRGSIGCNLGSDQPAILEFYRVLREIRAKPEVQDVLVRVCEFDDPNSWPFTDTVYVLTSAPLEQVRQWLVSLLPDEIHPEWMYGAPTKAPQLGAGVTPYSVWWD
jgi:hypothetical protein